MTLWWSPTQGLIDDTQQELPEYGELRDPSGTLVAEWGEKALERLPEYRNVGLYGDEAFQWDPARRVWSGGIAQTSPGYVPDLLDLQERVRAGQAPAYETEWYNQQVEQARAIPTRDIASLTAEWQGAGEGRWTDSGWEEAAPAWWTRLDPGSPDVGPIMLQLRDKMDRGQASSQEQALYEQTLAMARDWKYRASVPQESDKFSVLGNDLLGPLSILALGASAGAAAPLFAGGLGLGATLGAAGGLAGTAGQLAGMFGQALDVPALAKAGNVLGALGGLAGGAGGLANLWGTGVSSLGDAAKLAQSTGRITGALGRLSGAGPLQQAGKYLGYAGQIGNVGALALPTSVTDWSGGSAPLAGNVAPSVSNLLSAADVATQRGGDMADFSYEDFLGYGDPYGPGSSGDPSMDFFTSEAYQDFIGQGDPYGPGSSGDPNFAGAGGGGFLSSILGGLGSVAGFLGKNASTLGPLASTLGGVASGAIGSRAAGDASAQQAMALNRGIDLQTAQWLQQQANQAPWLQAGQQALGQLQGLTGQAGPQMPGATSAISGANYGLPGTTPTWSPQSYQGPAGVNASAYRWTPEAGPQAWQYGYQGPQAVQAGDYRWQPGQGPSAQDYRYTPGAIPSAAAFSWTPGQGPSAADYRYTPGQTPDAEQYASGPPQLYQGAMPGTQVSQLTGQQVLDQDPGAAFRQTEARKALEGSAAARGGLLSGSTLGALQRQSQDLASQEYGNAWQRMMSRDVEQYGRNWGQYQQRWGEGVTGTQLGMATNAQNFQQAMAASQLREQLRQTASQQGWSQAQTEAAFREQMAQLSSQQGFGQQMSEAQLREQVHQVATQQGWSQAQAEAVFREQMAQQASQQGFQQALGAQGQQWQQGMAGQQFDWTRAQQEAAFREQYGQLSQQQAFAQALAGQGQQFTQGLQGQQWNQQQQQQWQQEQYQRMMADVQTRYGWDVNQNTTDYARQQALYQQQLVEQARQWGQYSTLAGYGQTATNQVGNQGFYANEALGKLYGQLGGAQAGGTLGGANSWMNALQNVNTGIQGGLGTAAYQQGIQSVLGRLNA